MTLSDWSFNGIISKQNYSGYDINISPREVFLTWNKPVGRQQGFRVVAYNKEAERWSDEYSWWMGNAIWRVGMFEIVWIYDSLFSKASKLLKGPGFSICTFLSHISIVHFFFCFGQKYLILSSKVGIPAPHSIALPLVRHALGLSLYHPSEHKGAERILSVVYF